MNKVIENIKLVEIDRSKKYMILIQDDIPVKYMQKLVDDIQRWFSNTDQPFLVVDGSDLILMEVENNE